jgi:RND family efflux transporter MFP subunit
MRLASLVLAAGLSAAACGGEHAERREAAGAPVDVTLETASLRELARPFETGGTVRARTTATLVSRILAEVEAVLAHPGDRVRAGQVLIRLDGRDLQANRARAEASAAAAVEAIHAATTARDGADASLALAAATHRRIAALREKNSATPHELDQAVSALRAAESQKLAAQAAIAQAEAGAEAARAALRAASVAASWAAITAPFDGVVTEKLVEPGNMASPGAALMTLEDVGGFRLEVRVDESRVGEIGQTKRVDVVLGDATDDGPGAPALAGTIAEISRATSPGSHAYLVKIDLPDEGRLRSGMFGRARFAGAVRQALVVPEAAVARRGQLASVFVVGGDGRARLRLVNAGEPVGGLVEIAAGLDPGESVVVSPPASLVDGSPVRAAARSPGVRS